MNKTITKTDFTVFLATFCEEINAKVNSDNSVTVGDIGKIINESLIHVENGDEFKLSLGSRAYLKSGSSEPSTVFGARAVPCIPRYNK